MYIFVFSVFSVESINKKSFITSRIEEHLESQRNIDTRQFMTEIYKCHRSHIVIHKKYNEYGSNFARPYWKGIDQSTVLRFLYPMLINWSILTVRVQIEQAKLPEFNFWTM